MSGPILRLEKGSPLTATEHDRNANEILNDGNESVTAHGATGNGTTDDRAAILLAVATGRPIWFPPGVYRVGSALTISVPVWFARGARLVPDNGVAVHLSATFNAGDYDHIFDISKGGRITGTTAKRGYVTPFQFGATATGTSGDDTLAIGAAIRFGTLNPIRTEFAITPKVSFPVPKNNGAYHITKDIVVNRTTHLFGQSPLSGQYAPVKILVASSCTAGFYLCAGGISSATISPVYNGYIARAYLSLPPDGNRLRVRRNGVTYFSIFTHTSSTTNAPGTGADWTTYWISLGSSEPWEEDWVSGKSYLAPTFYGFNRGVVENLALEAVTPGGPDYGIVYNTVSNFYNVSCSGFRLAGFFAHGQTSHSLSWDDYGTPMNPNVGFGGGTMYGNTNASIHKRCAANNNRGFGFAAQGNNTQIMLYDTCEAVGNRAAGFYDNSSIGNQLINCYAKDNIWRVRSGGTLYMCVKLHTSTASNQPGVGASWSEFWVAIGSGTHDADWQTGTVYAPGGGVLNTRLSAQYCTSFAHRGEGDGGRIIPRGGAAVIGGRADQIFRHDEFTNVIVESGRETCTPPGWRHAVSDQDYGASLGSGASTPSVLFLSFDSTKDTDTLARNIRLGYSSARKAYEFNRAGTLIFLSLSGEGWSRAGYTGPGNVFAQGGMLLGDTTVNASAVVQIEAVANLASITGAVTRGQRWIYSSPVPGGKIGVICITSGTVGSGAVLKEFGSIEN